MSDYREKARELSRIAFESDYADDIPLLPMFERLAEHFDKALAAAERAGRIAELEAMPCWCARQYASPSQAGFLEALNAPRQCDRCRRLDALRAEGGK